MFSWLRLLPDAVRGTVSFAKSFGDLSAWGPIPNNSSAARSQCLIAARSSAPAPSRVLGAAPPATAIRGGTWYSTAERRTTRQVRGTAFEVLQNVAGLAGAREVALSWRRYFGRRAMIPLLEPARVR